MKVAGLIAEVALQQAQGGHGQPVEAAEETRDLPLMFHRKFLGKRIVGGKQAQGSETDDQEEQQEHGAAAGR